MLPMHSCADNFKESTVLVTPEIMRGLMFLESQELSEAALPKTLLIKQEMDQIILLLLAAVAANQPNPG